MPSFASVVLIDPGLAHLDRVFTYSIPEGMDARAGSVVRAPFRGKKRRGVIVSMMSEADIARPLPIVEQMGPGLPRELVELAEFVSQRYLATLGETLSAMTPERVKAEEERASPPASLPAAPMLSSFSELTNGARLVEAVESGGANGFVWRPAGARAAQIASLVLSVVARGGGVIVLVPEVASRSETMRALVQLAPDAVAWLGSDAKARARYRAWLDLRDGSKQIAAGGRGAVFAPVKNLKLIVIDDESNAAYKEGRAPRFHARTVAAERARTHNATVVLVGIPPSVEARAATERGPYILVSSPRAVERANRPPVTVIDDDTRLVPGPRTLQMARSALDEKQRVVIVTHKPDPGQRERVFRILRAAAPAWLDATSTQVERARAIKNADLILTTPVIAKDTLITDVGMLAFVETDAALVQPEFRAPEEAFATWWRAARWVKGHIVIETRQPSHPAVVALTRWDPDILFRAEVTRRRELGYPPFASLARIDVPCERAEEVAKALGTLDGIDVLGPAERDGDCVVVARSVKRERLLSSLRPLADGWRNDEEPMRIDVDPWEVLVPKWRS